MPRPHNHLSVDTKLHRGDADVENEEEDEEEEGQLDTKEVGIQVKVEPPRADLEDLRSMLSPAVEPGQRKHLGWGQGLARMQKSPTPVCSSKEEVNNAPIAQHFQAKVKEESVSGTVRISDRTFKGPTTSLQEAQYQSKSHSDSLGSQPDDRLPRKQRSTNCASVAVCEESDLDQQKSMVQNHLVSKDDALGHSKQKHGTMSTSHQQISHETSKQMMTEKEIQHQALLEQQENKKSIMLQIDDVDQLIQKVEKEIDDLWLEEGELEGKICTLTEKYAKQSLPPKQKVSVLFESKEEAAAARKQLVERIWTANAEKAAQASRDIGMPDSNLSPTSNGDVKAGAGSSSALWRMKREELPDVQSCAFFKENTLKHEKLHPLFLQTLRGRREDLIDQRLTLGLMYRKKWEQWQLRLAISRAKKERMDASRSIWDQRRTSSRFAGSTSSFSGIVRSEYEEMQVIAQLQKSEELKHLVRTPDMVIDDRSKEIRNFPSNNGLIRDPIKQRENELRSRPWGEDEIKVFKEKYLLHTKDFRKIASFLPGRTSQDCVRFYYQNQKSEEFAHVRRKQQLKKRRLYSEAKKLSGHYMDVTANTGKATATGGKQSPAANRSSATPGPNLDGKPQKDRTKGKRESSKEDGWHAQELELFLKAVKIHGKDFKAIAAEMGTRSASAIRTFWALNKKSMSLEKLAAESTKSKELVDMGKPKSVLALLKARGGLSSLSTAKDWSKQDRDTFLKAFKMNGSSASDIAKTFSSRTEQEIQACLQDIHKLVHGSPPKVGDAVKRTVSHWSQKEKDDFHVAFQTHGHDWKTISTKIQTKSPVQVKNYYQSYKQKNDDDLKQEGSLVSPPTMKRLAEEPGEESIQQKKQKKEEGTSVQHSYMANHGAVISAPERVQSASPSVNPETLAALYAGAQNPYLPQLAFTQQGTMPGLPVSHSLPMPSSGSWSVGGAQMSAFSPVSGGVLVQQDCESNHTQEAGGVQLFGQTILPDSSKAMEFQHPTGVFGQPEGGWHAAPTMPPEAAAAFSSMDPSLIAILQAAAAAQVAQFGGMNFFMPGAASGPSNAPVLPPDGSNPAEDDPSPSNMEQ